jgi:hypothetical protein
MKTYAVHIYDNLDNLQDRWGLFDSKHEAAGSAARHLEETQSCGWYAYIVEQRTIATVVLPKPKAVVTAVK